MKKRLPILLLLIAGLSWLAWTKYQGTKFRYSGTLEAEETDISPGVSSLIDSVEVKEGDAVKAGQLLLRLACQEVRIAASNIENDYARAERLYAAGSLPKASYDKLRYQRADAALKLSWCDLTAPIDAVVVSVHRRKGEWARPGVNLLTLADLAHPYAYVYLPLEARSRLKPGTPVTGHLGGREYKGAVSHLRPEAEFTPKNVQTREERERLVFGVKVAFENPDGLLTPGLPIEVTLPE